MKKKQTIQRFFAGLTFIFASFAFATPLSQPVQAAKCGDDIDTAILTCNGTNTGDIQDTAIWSLLLIAINILTAGIGVAALGGIIYGAFLYTSAGGSPDKVKRAREIFVNVVIGVISFAAMYALLNFLIPGGIFT